MADLPSERLSGAQSRPSGAQSISIVGEDGNRISLGRLAAPEDGPAQVRRYLGLWARYRAWVLVATALGLGAGLIGARLSRPVYLAQGTVWVEASRGGRGEVDDRGPIRQGQLVGALGWVDLVKSYIVLDHVVQQTRLYLKPSDPADSTYFSGFALKEKFRPGTYRLALDQTGGWLELTTTTGQPVDRAPVGDSLGRPAGFDWVPTRGALQPGDDIEFAVTTPRDAARLLASDLAVEMDREGNFLRVELRGTDPYLIASAVNGVIDRFVTVTAQLKREKMAELAKIIGEQLGRAEQSLRQAENALENFRVQTVTLPSGVGAPIAGGIAQTRDPVYNNFFDMRMQVDEVRRDRQAIERALAGSADSALSTDALEIIGAVQRSSDLMIALKELTEKRAELRAMRYRYTEEHKPAQTLAENIAVLETRAIPSIATSLVAELRARESELETRISSASRELRQIPPRTIQETRLERDVAIVGALYTMLQQRYEEARLAEASSIPDVRVLDSAAVPDRPVANPAIRFVVLGLLLGLGSGLGGAALRDSFDRRVRHPDHVTAHMGLPVLGVVPRLNGAAGVVNGTLPVVEALRGIRLNLVHAYGTAGPLIVTVTSPGVGDGKSFLASNLALSFAEGGHRTLLIDGDCRRGVLHQTFSTQRKPGLVDYLAKNCQLTDVVLETSFPALRFIPSGTRLSSAPELLGSPEMIQLLAAVRSEYSVIIIDSPPMSGGVDAYELATITGNLVMVLRAGSSDRQDAEGMLGILDRLPVRVLGAVLNDVRDASAFRYYAYYHPAYHLEDESGRLPNAARKLVGRGA